MRTLILAAGRQRKWRRSGGKGHKQFVEIGGEPIIRRTFRLASERCPDVLTVVRDPEHPRWEGLNPREARMEDWMGGQGKFLHHRHLWGDHDLVVLYGDVYYTKATLDTIYGHEPTQPTVYGRAKNRGPKGNRRKRRLEAFALRWNPEHREEVVRIAKECCEVGMNHGGGEWRWFLRRHTGASTYSAGRVKPLATEENGWVELGHDATEDFDRLRHVERWRAR